MFVTLPPFPRLMIYIEKECSPCLFFFLRGFLLPIFTLPRIRYFIDVIWAKSEICKRMGFFLNRKGIVHLYDCNHDNFLSDSRYQLSGFLFLFFPVLYFSHTARKAISYHAVFMLTSPSSLAAVVDFCSRILQSFPVHALYGVNFWYL